MRRFNPVLRSAHRWATDVSAARELPTQPGRAASTRCDAAECAATVTRTPAPDEVPFPVDVQQVVEYYAVRL